ncbi:MAG: murein biosynthesis integral membrane protein MurJ [Defluviitaleaceae bacterium]|nr:murein biosynthesis integral membrane protein MurJ [Defluviitaleaceae bacterium]
MSTPSNKPKVNDNSVKTISVVMVLVLVAKISGLARDMAMMSLLGTESAEAAAFNFASLLPRQFLDAAFAAAISAGFIPVFNGYLEKRGREAAFALAGNFITFIMLLSLIAAILGFFAAGIISGIYFGDAPNITVELGGQLLQITIFTMFFTSTAFALTGLLQSLGGFYIPSIMSLVSNSAILVYLLLFFERWGVFGLAVVFLVGSVLQVAIFWHPLRKHGFKMRLGLSLRDKGLREILRLSPMVMVSSWLFPINIIVNSGIAANLNPAYSVELNAANVIFMVSTGMFILSVTNVVFPKLSKQAAHAENREEFRETLAKSVSALMFLLMPMTAGLWILRIPIIRLAYERQEFSAYATQRASHALGILAMGIVGYGLISILNRAFYADKDGKTPMIITVIAIAINAVTALLLINPMAIGGPALAATVSVNFAGFAMYAIAARKYRLLDKASAVNYGKMILSTTAMLGVLFMVWQVAGHLHDVLTIGITFVLGILIYITTATILGVSEAKTAKTAILSRFGRKDKKDE